MAVGIIVDGGGEWEKRNELKGTETEMAEEEAAILCLSSSSFLLSSRDAMLCEREAEATKKIVFRFFNKNLQLRLRVSGNRELAALLRWYLKSFKLKSDGSFF